MVAEGRLSGFETPELLGAIDTEALPIEAAELDRNVELIEELEADSVRLMTVLDDDYPLNLRLVYDRPPFLFVRGRIEPTDVLAIAVVGTRSASEPGLEQADRLARGLCERGVTVVSGLAKGIDAAAHAGALAAAGRTIAVMGTGIKIIYPREHAELAERIVASGGALVSQFWPDSPPTRYRFPMRNRTMSGLALGTVVVEASYTSGARMQARIALEHGKRVFLVEGLVTREKWTERYHDHVSVSVVSSVDGVLDVIDRPPGQAEQLTLVA
jgi:DNA processing protein